MVKMISPNGDTVEVPENKIEKCLNRGFKHADTPKTIEPEEVQEDSHEEINHNEEEA